MRALIIISTILCFISLIQGQVVRYSSSCSVPLCNSTSSSNSGCSSSPTCYQFKTSINTTLCAPQVICSLFDACTSGTKCATNNSVCVINSCCTVPICMPLALSSQCSSPNTSTSVSTPPAICPNATWDLNDTNILSSAWNGNNSLSLTDFSIDVNDNIYIYDSNSKQFYKLASNSSTLVQVGGPGMFSLYSASRMFVDFNGAVYTSDSQYSYSVNNWLFRVQKYDAANWVDGTTIFGETQCGTGLNQFCGCSDIFVDRQGAIYCSDYLHQRVLKITANNSFATIVAGVSNVTGSQLNQLNNPQGIFVDVNYTLYVLDLGNRRVLAFAAGNQYGTVLFSFASSSYFYMGTGAIAVDVSGSVYVSGYNNITRWVPTTSTLSPILSPSAYGNRMRLDSKANIYTTSYMYYTGLYKYNIISTTC